MVYHLRLSTKPSFPSSHYFFTQNFSSCPHCSSHHSAKQSSLIGSHIQPFLPPLSQTELICLPRHQFLLISRESIRILPSPKNLFRTHNQCWLEFPAITQCLCHDSRHKRWVIQNRLIILCSTNKLTCSNSMVMSTAE